MSAKQKKINPAERRCSRREVVTQKPKGILKLHLENRCLDVVRIHDISPFGICLQLHGVVSKGAQIRLTYAVGTGSQTEVSGTVVWQKPVKSPGPIPSEVLGWWVGIYLHPGSTDANFALYQAIMENQKDWQLGEFKETLYW